jgi:AcrR family transcriptional regulator
MSTKNFFAQPEDRHGLEAPRFVPLAAVLCGLETGGNQKTMATKEKPPARRASIGARRNPASEAAILAAAEAILRENGLSGFSIEAVARRAHAGKPTIYRWWPSKTALLLEIYQRQKNVVAGIDTGNIEDDCLAFLEGVFASWRDTGAGQVFRSIFAEAQSDDAAAQALGEYAADRRAQTGRMFERAKLRGELAADANPEIAAELLAAFAWSRLLTARLRADRQELRAVVRQFLGGVLRR